MDPEFSPDDVFIAVMGLTGAGKSTFISQCVPSSPSIIGHTLSSCTFGTSAHTTMIAGKRVHLIDTPGFDDSRRSDAQTLQESAFWLTQATSHGINLAGMIYCHRITDNRVQGSSIRSFQIFKKICGDQNFHACLLVTTHWDLVLPDPALRAQAFLRQSEITTQPQFWGDIVDRGGTYGSLIGEQSARKLVETLVCQQHTIILQLQEQLSVPGSRLCDTNAGKVVSNDYKEHYQRLQQELHEVKAELSIAHQEHHDKNIQEFESLTKDIEAKAESRSREIAEMELDHQFVVNVTLRRITSDREQFMRMAELNRHYSSEQFQDMLRLCRDVTGQMDAQKKLADKANRPKKSPKPHLEHHYSEPVPRAKHNTIEKARTPPPPYTPSANEMQLIRQYGQSRLPVETKSTTANKISAGASVASAAIALTSLAACSVM